MPASRYLLPGPSLEDFPTEVSEPEASSLLATWTVLWHPCLLSQYGIPRWQRADSPSPPAADELVAIPDPAIARLPADFRSQAEAAGAVILEGTKRSSILQRFPQAEATDFDEDFFALGYAYLQVQLMTRRLRYSSNLNETVFAQTVLAAASAVLASDCDSVRSHLQEAFDLLAQERDHYFAGDPSLIDLSLVAESTAAEHLVAALASEPATNLLIAPDTLERQCERDRSLGEAIAERLAAGTMSLAGGLPDRLVGLESISPADLRRELSAARATYLRAVRAVPAAFGRLTDGCAGDLAGPLEAAGYRGALFADFLAGQSSGESESKLRWEGGGGRIDTITSEPVDAGSNQSFVALGPKLGKLLDAGGTATCVLAHWAGHGSEAFRDLCRVAGWSLVLGKFRTLARYFADTAKPYHSFRPPVDHDAGGWLESLVHARTPAPLSGIAHRTASCYRKEIAATERALLQAASDHPGETIESLLSALGGTAGANDRSFLLLNPWSWPARTLVDCGAAAAAERQEIYAMAAEHGRVSAAVDVPPTGFVSVETTFEPPKQRWWPQRATADRRGLRNEFLEVAIDDATGGVQAIYSAVKRGTLGAWQLARFDAAWGETAYTRMRSDTLRVVATGGLCGAIEVRGTLRDPSDVVTDRFVLRYRLPRGLRGLLIDIELEPLCDFRPEPWQSYVAARVAWDDETATLRPLVRCRSRAAKGRRLNAPQGVIVESTESSLLVASNGLPAHCRSGPRMLDTLLIVQGETSYQAHLGYFFAPPRPVATACEMLAPLTPRYGWSLPTPVGWFFAIDQPSVVAVDWRTVTEGPRVAAVRVLLVETIGQACVATLSSCRKLSGASLLDGLDQVTQPLETTEDSVKVWLAAHQQQAVELRFT